MTKQMMNRTLCGHLAHSQQDMENEGGKRPCLGLSPVQFHEAFSDGGGLDTHSVCDHIASGEGPDFTAGDRIYAG